MEIFGTGSKTASFGSKVLKANILDSPLVLKPNSRTIVPIRKSQTMGIVTSYRSLAVKGVIIIGQDGLTLSRDVVVINTSEKEIEIKDGQPIGNLYFIKNE